MSDEGSQRQPGNPEPPDSGKVIRMPQPPIVETTQELFERAVRLHTRRLMAIARAIVGYRASPEDVVQQAFMNLYQHRDRYDWREPGGLLRRTVVNESLRILRQPRITALADDVDNSRRGGAAGEESPSSHMLESEAVEQVRRAIDRLPENYRSALVLCEYEKMPYAQIAETLDASIPQVKTWIHRGRRQLAEMLRPYAESANITEKTTDADSKPIKKRSNQGSDN